MKIEFFLNIHKIEEIYFFSKNTTTFRNVPKYHKLFFKEWIPITYDPFYTIFCEFTF